jgi:hypothetical protein
VIPLEVHVSTCPEFLALDAALVRYEDLGDSGSLDRVRLPPTGPGGCTAALPPDSGDGADRPEVHNASGVRSRRQGGAPHPSNGGKRIARR